MEFLAMTQLPFKPSKLIVIDSKEKRKNKFINSSSANCNFVCDEAVTGRVDYAFRK